MTSDAERIGRGLPPKPWEQTFEHPRLGPLTFKATLPRALELAEHSVRIDNVLAGLTSEPRVATMILAAAIAGLAHEDGVDAAGRSCLVELPCVREDRVDEPEKGSVRIERHFYDAAAESDIAFLIEVWNAFSIWRRDLLEEVDAVKGSSGVTDGNGSKQPSAAPTNSPSTTPA